jgi:hypothetical protein
VFFSYRAEAGSAHSGVTRCAKHGSTAGTQSVGAQDAPAPGQQYCCKPKMTILSKHGFAEMYVVSSMTVNCMPLCVHPATDHRKASAHGKSTCPHQLYSNAKEACVQFFNPLAMTVPAALPVQNSGLLKSKARTARLYGEYVTNRSAGKAVASPGMATGLPLSLTGPGNPAATKPVAGWELGKALKDGVGPVPTIGGPHGFVLTMTMRSF